MERKIIYEPHPVSEERKQKLVSEGFVIIDKRFEPETKTAPKPRTTKAKQ